MKRMPEYAPVYMKTQDAALSSAVSCVFMQKMHKKAGYQSYFYNSFVSF